MAVKSSEVPLAIEALFGLIAIEASDRVGLGAGVGFVSPLLPVADAELLPPDVPAHPAAIKNALQAITTAR